MQDQHGVVDLPGRVAMRRAEGDGVQPHLGQRLAAVEGDVVQDGVALGLAGPAGLRGRGLGREQQQGEQDVSHRRTVRAAAAGGKCGRAIMV